jgi:hypothetical protein
MARTRRTARKSTLPMVRVKLPGVSSDYPMIIPGSEEEPFYTPTTPPPSARLELSSPGSSHTQPPTPIFSSSPLSSIGGQLLQMEVVVQINPLPGGVQFVPTCTTGWIETVLMPEDDDVSVQGSTTHP